MRMNANGINCALVVAFLLVHREPSTRTSDAPTPQRAALAFWRGLRPTRLFVWAWTIRFLVNLVNALVLLYLYFYLSDEVGESDPGSWVLVVTLLVVVVAAATAGVAGTLSDRWGRRRSLAVFIIGTTLPTFALAAAMQHFHWILPVSPLLPNRPVPAPELVSLFWSLTLAYAVFQGLMYGVGPPSSWT